MKTSTILFQFIIILIIGLIPAFLLQNNYGFQDQNLTLAFTYTFNILFSLPFVIILLLMIDKIKRHIGFIFLGLGFLKVLAFLGYTKWNAIDINRDNFLMFFVPYFICIFAEVFILSKYLNKVDF